MSNSQNPPTVDPKFHALIPPLSADEFNQLEANILKDGCRDSIVTWKGKLIDGHNRLEICQRHNIPFSTKEIQLADERAAEIWIIRNQFGRRNIAPYVRAVLALKLEPLLKEKAKEKETERKMTLPKSAKSSVPKVNTREDLAKAASVSQDTIAKVKVIEARATPEAKAAIRSGESSINAEYKKLTVHVGHNSGENEWYTPTEFIVAARKTMGSIDCDPASSKLANKTVKAQSFFTAEQDGLKQKWNGSAWLNPPYAQPLIAQFAEAVCDKFKSREIKQACVLVNNATETAWFQQILETASAVCFVRGRVKFLDPNGNPGAPLQGQTILYLGKKSAAFKSAFQSFGPILFHEPVP